MKTRRGLIPIILLLLLLLCPDTAAAEKDFFMPRLIIHLHLQADGSLLVAEERTVTFQGNINGFYQYIPLDPSMDIHSVQVREGDTAYAFNPGTAPGAPGTFFVVKKPDSIFIDWSLKAYNETRTFLLTYQIDNAVLIHEDTAELYMKFVGEDWDRGVEEAAVYLIFPGEVAREDIRAFGHGPLHGRVEILEDGRVSWQVNPLPRKTFLEGRVLFPRELVPRAVRFSGREAREEILKEEAGWAARADRLRLLSRLEWLAGALILLAGLMAAFLFWRKYGREYRADFDGDYYRDLPGDYSPAELGILWRFGKTTPADLTATILDLARKGYVTLEEDRREIRGIFRSKTDIQYLIKKKREDKGSLLPHEEQVMAFLFRQAASSSDEVSFQEIEQYAKRNQRSFLSFWSGWLGELKARGFVLEFFDPLTKQGKAVEIVSGVALAGLSVPAFMAALYIIFFALLLSGLLLVLAGAFLRRRSQKGVNDFARWRAFRRFLLHFSEMERSSIPSLAIWEHYLVYAATLGVAREVLRQLQVVYPNLTEGSYRFGAHWYYMSGTPGRGFSPVNALDDLTSGLQKSFQVATSASSSKGSGGGFSGGGGGGFGGGGGGVR